MAASQKVSVSHRRHRAERSLGGRADGRAGKRTDGRTDGRDGGLADTDSQRPHRRGQKKAMRLAFEDDLLVIGL